MKLNIHLISHPIIQDLSNKSYNSKLSLTINNEQNKYLGLLIIYETLRKWLKIYQLTIKKTTSKKKIMTIDPKEIYTIIFDNLNNLCMFHEINFLLPQVNLKLITNRELELNRLNSEALELNTFNLYTKIIIVNYKINIDYIKNLIPILIQKNRITIQQIYLICIKCETSQLIKLSNTELYKDLQIYTTQITNN